jgi:hypothetical protein
MNYFTRKGLAFRFFCLSDDWMVRLAHCIFRCEVFGTCGTMMTRRMINFLAKHIGKLDPVMIAVEVVEDGSLLTTYADFCGRPSFYLILSRLRPFCNPAVITIVWRSDIVKIDCFSRGSIS